MLYDPEDEFVEKSKFIFLKHIFYQNLGFTSSKFIMCSYQDIFLHLEQGLHIRRGLIGKNFCFIRPDRKNRIKSKSH